MIDEADLGPPRLANSMDEWDAETARQHRAVESGDLRRFAGATWAWCRFGADDKWRWLSRWSTCGIHWSSRDDREEAWDHLVRSYNE